MNIPRELLEQLHKGNVVLFCGAGISTAPNGLPTGTQLAQELAQRAGLDDVSGMTLPDVAQAYELEMGLQSLIAYVSSRIDDPGYAPLRTHQLIAELPFKRIITTNWDTLLEEALRQAGRPFAKVVRDSDIAYSDEEKVLFVKLHGSIDQKDTLVITGDDYYDVFARLPEAANLVQTFFATRTLLFLGFGLADEDFKRLYHEVVRHLGEHKRRAYAVQLEPAPLTVRYWEQKNVQIIDADAAEFLEALNAQLGLAPSPGPEQQRQPAPSDSREPSPRPPDATPAPSPSPAELRRVLTERFDLEELRNLCFDLGIDFDNLRGEGKAAKARELVAYLQRRQELERLIVAIRRERGEII